VRLIFYKNDIKYYKWDYFKEFKKSDIRLSDYDQDKMVIKLYKNDKLINDSVPVELLDLRICISEQTYLTLIKPIESP
jgi:hypothetical protein